MVVFYALYLDNKLMGLDVCEMTLDCTQTFVNVEE